MKTKEQEVLCCFCGNYLLLDKAIEITINIDRESDDKQSVCAHAKCLDNVLHKSMPRAFGL